VIARAKVSTKATTTPTAALTPDGELLGTVRASVTLDTPAVAPFAPRRFHVEVSFDGDVQLARVVVSAVDAGDEIAGSAVDVVELFGPDIMPDVDALIALLTWTRARLPMLADAHRAAVAR